MKNLIFSIIIIAFVISCDPCSECGEPVLFEPTAEMVFINQDSINHIDDSLQVFAFNDSSLNANIDSLEVLSDSLQVLLDSIQKGGSLENEKMQVEDWIASQQSDSLRYATLNKDADSLSTIMTATKSTINSGLMRINELTIIETGESISYADSSTYWNFPLLFDENSATYSFTIEDEAYLIELGYETFTEVDEERNVLIRANNIVLVESSENFISLDSCNVNCEDGNATFTFYF